MAVGAWRQLITLDPVVREQREKDAGALPLSLFINLRVGAVHVQGFPTSVKAFWKHPHRRTQSVFPRWFPPR